MNIELLWGVQYLKGHRIPTNTNQTLLERFGSVEFKLVNYKIIMDIVVTYCARIKKT
jgi:hypothetical protein